jgi:hypothetical protein
MAGTLAPGERFLPSQIASPARGHTIRAKPEKKLRLAFLRAPR